jgi:hypothetical protein
MLSLVGEEEVRYDDDDGAKDIDDIRSDKASATNYEVEEDGQCRKGNVPKGVYNPGRLSVLFSCEEAIGMIHNSERVSDGDYNFYLEVKDDYMKLLNEANDERANGMIVVEIYTKSSRF